MLGHIVEAVKTMKRQKGRSFIFYSTALADFDICLVPSLVICLKRLTRRGKLHNKSYSTVKWMDSAAQFMT